MTKQGLVLPPSGTLPRQGTAAGIRVVSVIFFGLIALFSVGVDAAMLNPPGCGVAAPMGRILGGDPVWDRRQMPWIVELKVFALEMPFTCGGSIITRSVILTAAHCLIKPSGSAHNAYKVEVYYNTTEHWRGQIVLAKRMIVHGEYTPRRLYDVALLKLQRPLRFDAFVKPVCLPMRKIPVARRKLLVAGWGIFYNGTGLSSTLQYVELDATDDTFCKTIIRDMTSRNKDLKFGPVICTFNTGKGSCQGDSGGPVWLRGVRGKSIQVGVVSAGAVCHKGKLAPMFFSRLFQYMRWIKKALARPKAWTPLVTWRNANAT